MNMTHRERVLAAIEHREPDRLPIDCGAMRSSGISGIAYNRLKVHLNHSDGHTRMYDAIQQLAFPEQWLLDDFRISAIDAGWSYSQDDDLWRPWNLPDGSPAEAPTFVNLEQRDGIWILLNSKREVLARMPKGATYFDQAIYPLANETDFDGSIEHLGELLKKISWCEIPSPPWHIPLTEQGLTRMSCRLRQFRQTTDRAILLGFGGSLFEVSNYLWKMDNVLMAMALEPAKLHRLLDKLVQHHLSTLDIILPAIKDSVDIIVLGDDLGSEKGTLFSPQMYREFFKPRFKAIINHIKQNSSLYVFLHSCGSISSILEDLIEAGVDIINPVQTSAANMAPAELKRVFGDSITFWGGGCDTQSVLGQATPVEIRDHVRKRIETFAPGGGFVFSQVHNILPNVPPENITAMWQTATEY